MLLPLLLIVLATVAAAMVAYGVSPGHALELIVFARRLEWPLVLFCILLCLILIGLVIANKRRAWWLLGLAPILALLIHRFAPWESKLYVVDFEPTNPVVLPADDNWVVGVVFNDQAYALSYSSLYIAPVVIITDYDKRLLVMWSARANRAVAYTITRELKPRDLEIVTTPDDTVLIYDQRLGQFIVAVTGKTVGGQKPVWSLQPVTSIVKTTWKTWHVQHPDTKVMQMFRSDAPTGPVLPSDADHLIHGVESQTRIALLPTTQPTAIQTDSIGTQPTNLVAGQNRLLIFRDPSTQRLRAFDRNLKEDLFLTFTPKTNRKIHDAVMIDSDTNSWWTIDGKAVDGQLKGSQLRELPLEQDLYWGVMKHWYPQLEMGK